MQRLRTGAWALVVLCAAPLLAPRGAQEDGSVEWLGDLNQATELAVETGRPLLIVFR